MDRIHDIPLERSHHIIAITSWNNKFILWAAVHRVKDTQPFEDTPDILTLAYDPTTPESHPWRSTNLGNAMPTDRITNAAAYGPDVLFFATSFDHIYCLKMSGNNVPELRGPLIFNLPPDVPGTRVRRVALLPVSSNACLISVDVSRTWYSLVFKPKTEYRVTDACKRQKHLPSPALLSPTATSCLALDPINNTVTLNDIVTQLDIPDTPFLSVYYFVCPAFGECFIAATAHKFLLYTRQPDGWTCLGQNGVGPNETDHEYSPIPGLVDLAYHNNAIYYTTSIGDITRFPLAAFSPDIEWAQDHMPLVPFHKIRDSPASLFFNFVVGNTIAFTDSHVAVFSSPARCTVVPLVVEEQPTSAAV